MALFHTYRDAEVIIISCDVFPGQLNDRVATVFTSRQQNPVLTCVPDRFIFAFSMTVLKGNQSYAHPIYVKLELKKRQLWPKPLENVYFLEKNTNFEESSCTGFFNLQDNPTPRNQPCFLCAFPHDQCQAKSSTTKDTRPFVPSSGCRINTQQVASKNYWENQTHWKESFSIFDPGYGDIWAGHSTIGWQSEAHPPWRLGMDLKGDSRVVIFPEHVKDSVPQ